MMSEVWFTGDIVITISVFDTSVSSSNIGDQIIMSSVRAILEDLFKDALFISIQTHDVISKNSYDFIEQSDLKFVGGTNLLSSNMDYYNQWKINLSDSLYIKDIILLGVGWWQYQDIPNMYTRILYNRILSKQYLHSVRDSYTERQLNLAGINNVINTSCPTMWSLTKEHCKTIPRRKSKDAVMTFTEYNQNLEYDKELFSIVQNNYDTIYYWTSQPGDYLYMKSIAGNKVIYLSPTLQALDNILLSKRLDYIGIRLHAGIRSLQYNRRSLIIAVDNRAKEISADTNLPVIDRKDLSSVKHWICSDYTTDINLPDENIKKWKSQFF
jgi:polysaccharide pyruvyl transferase WcaK-like protein